MDTKTLCLAVLSMGDASGYEIRKRVEEVFSRFMDVAPSGIYAALKILDQEGLVTAKVVHQENKPNKTVYSLLEPGREALVAALAGLEGRHRIRSELVAMLMFSDMIPPRKMREVLARRVLDLEEVRAEMEDHDVRSPGQRFLVGLGRTLVDAELAYLRGHLPGFLAQLDRGRDPEKEPADAFIGQNESSGALP